MTLKLQLLLPHITRKHFYLTQITTKFEYNFIYNNDVDYKFYEIYIYSNNQLQVQKCRQFS